jgi:hypothetical protein
MQKNNKALIHDINRFVKKCDDFLLARQSAGINACSGDSALGKRRTINRRPIGLTPKRFLWRNFWDASRRSIITLP